MNGQVSGQPAIILIRPQMGENIGKTARAMLNFGLTDLRLVAPRDGWPNPAATPLAAGADSLLETATVYDTVDAAIAGLTRVYATTARPRELIKEVMTPRHAGIDMHREKAQGQQVGILFGPEATGMLNDEIALSDAVISVPLNPDFKSLNLAQAVLIIAYEWYQAADNTAPARLASKDAIPATKEQLLGFFEHLEAELDKGGFLRAPEKRPAMVRNIRSMFERAHLMAHEVRTLRGIVKALTLYYGRFHNKP